MIGQALLLAGGRGTRMWPLTATVPKGLIPVAGEPFLDLQIGRLRDAGVEEILLAVGRAQLDQWESFAAARQGVGLVVENEPLDTAGPVRAALERLDERFLVLNGDVLFDADLGGLAAAADPEAAGTLALVEVEDTSAYGVVVVESGRVAAFVEKPPPEEAPARTVNAGMYVLRRDAVSRYPEGSLSFERVVFPDLVASGSLGAVVVEGRWLDIGTPDLYLECSGSILRGETSIAAPAEPHLVEGAFAGRGRGSWSWVASEATVAEDAIIEEAVVLPGASIGSGAVVSGAIVGWGAAIGHDAIVTGSTVVGAGAIVGSACELDHGMRIAPGAEIAPGAVTFNPPD